MTDTLPPTGDPTSNVASPPVSPPDTHPALNALLKALIRLWSSSTPSHGAVSLGADASIHAYAETLIEGHYDPEAALASIERFTVSQTWPDLQTFLHSLPMPGPPLKQLSAPPPGAQDGEDWCARCNRLFPTPQLGAIRFSRIGVARWGPLMQRHSSLTDAELVGAIERLDRGHAAFSDDHEMHAPFTPQQAADFRAAMAKVRSWPAGNAMRVGWERIGKTIERRQFGEAEVEV